MFLIISEVFTWKDIINFLLFNVLNTLESKYLCLEIQFIF